MDSGAHEIRYLQHVFGDLQYALGTLFACGDRQMVGRTSGPTFFRHRGYKVKGYLRSIMCVGSGIEMGGPGNMIPA
jgi:hypothetical protein